MRFLYHKQQRATVGRTPLDEWPDRRRDLYLTTHNTHNRQTSMPPVGFEPTISSGERPQNYALRPRGHWDRLFILTAPHDTSIPPARRCSLSGTRTDLCREMTDLQRSRLDCSFVILHYSLYHRMSWIVCVSFLSCPQEWQLYRIWNLHPPW
jgi:hypothetical protein